MKYAIFAARVTDGLIACLTFSDNPCGLPDLLIRSAIFEHGGLPDMWQVFSLDAGIWGNSYDPAARHFAKVHNGKVVEIRSTNASEASP